MNANRMKYASTPTYGIQKRGFLKKNAAKQEPDFTKAPDPLAATPPTPAFSATPPQGYAQQPPFVQQSVPMGTQPFLGQPMNTQAVPPATQIPFAMPNFIQPGGMPQQVMPQYKQPLQPNAPFQTGSPILPPLGNSAPPINAIGGFAPRAQGYVPPAAQTMQTAARPAVQPAPFTTQPLNANPFYPGTMPGGTAMQPPPAGYPPVSPPMQGFGQGAPMGQGGAQQSAFSAPSAPAQKPARERKPMDANRLWSVFLFGLLPLLFIPCIFVPASLNLIRYIFLALTVCGLGGMWYRQMYTSTTRFVVSVIYVALCVVAIAMSSQGLRDAQRTGGSSITPQSAQVSLPPDDSGSLGAAAPTETPAPTPEPTISGPSQAQQRLETFMALWQVNNIQEMVSLVQPSWASAQENPSTALFNLLLNRTPETYTIEDVSGSEQDTSRTVTMTASINKNNGKDPVVYRFMVIMVKESEDWYVNPNSLATNDTVETQDANVVNSQGSTSATAAPRTTVTPAPPADTMLYFNPNGGKSYHKDQNCSSVNSSYLPLQGSFPYSDLGNHNLTPCLKCGAPVNTLPPE